MSDRTAITLLLVALIGLPLLGLWLTR